MEAESKKGLKYLTNQPARVHNYGKLNKSESPRTHSSPTSILRKFPHSLRHDQKHQTKLKRDVSPVNVIISTMNNRNEGKTNRCVKSWCIGDEESDDSEERPSSEDTDKCHGDEDSRKKRKFSETSSECSSDGDLWKLQPAFINIKSVHEMRNAGPRGNDSIESEQQNPKDDRTIESLKKLSVISNSCENKISVNKVSELRRRTEFPVHKSTPNLLRNETFDISSSPSRPDLVNGLKYGKATRVSNNNRHVPLKGSDSLPQLDQTYRIIHSILPKINRTISESHESLSRLKNLRPYIKSESHIENINGINRSDSRHSKICDVVGSSQSEEENEGLSLIDGHRKIIIQSPRDRKNRWKKSVDIMPSLRNFMNRRSKGGGDLEETAPPDVAAPLMTSHSPSSESCSNLNIPEIRYFDEDDDDLAVKKYETVYALTNLIRADSNLQVEPMKPVNRLRVPPNGFYGSTSRMCSRCSSLLSMASSSRYSINSTGSGFVSCSPTLEKPPEPILLCKLCLMEVPVSLSMEINHCGCVFCKDCMRLYVEYEIQEGAYDISCPDAQCMKQGVVTLTEVETLVMPQMMERYLRFRLNHEVDMDRNRTWCPRAGCETVCNICPREKCAPTSVHCPTCDSDFCSNCKNPWHKGLTCEENSKKLAKEGRADFMEPGIPFDSDFIKCCPMCNVPIEKDEGCAQMMCKRCKHVFCWYCLASLDDDFLLRHYDKGPCKNKLGHTRASVIWHRTQVIGIFAGLGLLLLVASPLLLLAAPCIVCCKCRVCSGTKLDADDDLPEESVSCLTDSPKVTELIIRLRSEQTVPCHSITVQRHKEGQAFCLSASTHASDRCSGIRLVKTSSARPFTKKGRLSSALLPLSSVNSKSRDGVPTSSQTRRRSTPTSGVNFFLFIWLLTPLFIISTLKITT